jgi:hypothetical protein
MGTLADSIREADTANKRLWKLRDINPSMKEEVKIMTALRYNEGKPQYSYVDLTCLEPCARVLEFGAKKYSRDNWRKGMPTEQLLDSLMRHISALQRGELVDPESGISHIGHIQANAMFLGNKNNSHDSSYYDEK